MGKKTSGTLFFVLTVASFLTLVTSVTSHAIPAFTRANNVECSACHTIFPELNEYGEAFLKNAYVFSGKVKKKVPEKPVAAPAVVEAKPVAVPGGERVVKGEGDAGLLAKLKAGMLNPADAPVPAVADHAEAPVNGCAVLCGETPPTGGVLSGVPEQLPVSLTATIYGTYDHRQPNEYDLSGRSLKLSGGGNFKEKAGFFGSYLLYSENTSGTANSALTPGTMTGKNDSGELFLIWRHALETPINIKVGRFQPKLGLWKSGDTVSGTNPYAPYAYTVGASLFKLELPQDAVEANMIVAGRLFMAGGIVNRKNRNAKEWYVHTSMKVGGADYVSSVPGNDYDRLAVTVGGYGYVGTNDDSGSVAGPAVNQNNYYRTGVDIDLLYALCRLKLSGVMGNDDNPALTYLLPPVKTYVAAIEGEYTLLSNLIGSLRFEYQDDAGIVRRYIPAVTYAPMENLKVVIAYRHEFGKPAGTAAIANKTGTFGVTFSF